MNNLHHPNDIIGDRYRIVASLGQGGMGTTYEAEDLSNYQRVAIKVLFLTQMTDWKILDLFEREAKVLQNLAHPQIPEYLDYFHLDTENDRRFYLVQELVTGEPLGNLVQKGWHPQEEEVKEIATQILNILDYLHQLNPPVIHRDIKPQNILRRPDGQVYLVDFGAVQDVYRNTLSMGGTFVGTLGYMSPEQFGGKCYPASDLYSLGITLIFLLTQTSPTELPQKRMKLDFRSRVSVSENFGNWLEKMLEPIMEDRFDSSQKSLQILQELSSLQSHYSISQQDPLSFNALTIQNSPPGSSIILKKSNRHLIAEIPYQFDDSTSGCLFFLFGLSFFCTSAIIIALVLISPFLSFLLIFIVFFVFLTTPTNTKKRGSFNLEINSEYFKFIEWRNRRINTLKIEENPSDMFIYINSSSLFVRKINKNKEYNICQKITLGEKEWLAAEINSFLQQL